MSLLDLEEHTCGSCGIRYAAPRLWWNERRRDKRGFFCPNGHERVFSKSEEDKLREELSRVRQNNAYLEDRIKDKERIRIALAGQITKLKKRSSAGVCPCCNRTFTALGRHMQTKHPGFVAEPMADNVVPISKGAAP